jgi:hypothetical protein
MWTKTADGSVVDNNGKIIFFSTDRFISDICLGNCCFICGARPEEKEFNNEHILPEWLLRRFDLFSKTITLSNGAAIRYDRFTIPCCSECNALMGHMIESEIAQIVRGGANAINDFAAQGNLLKLFVWLGLIYLKTHLKDRLLRAHLDMRNGDAKLGDGHDWELLHHLHCVVRSFYTGCYVEREAVGSFLSIPVRAPASRDLFDFADLFAAQTLMMRLDDVAMFAVFDDSGGAMSIFWQKLRKINGPVSEMQLREIMVELAYINRHLKERPTFHSELDLVREECRIVATRPVLQLSKMDRRVRGELLHYAVDFALPQLNVVGRSREEVLASIKAGTFSFLFNDNGEFIKEPWKPL